MNSDINRVADILREAGFTQYQQLRSIVEAPDWDCDLSRIRNLARRIESLEHKLILSQEKHEANR
jgi:hypothetical protein